MSATGGDSIEQLDGSTKAAILLLCLEQDAATAIMREMPHEQVEELGAILAGLEDVPRRLADAVVREFQGMRTCNEAVAEGGADYAARLVRDALEPTVAESIIDRIEDQVGQRPFEFLRRVAAERVLAAIEDEHPQTIALVVSHLAPPRAATVVAGLPDRKQAEVVRRIAELDHADPEVLQEVESGLKSRLSGARGERVVDSGGVATVARVLNRCDRPTESAILRTIGRDDPELESQIRRSMFTFEDLHHVNDRGIQAVLREIENDVLCLALKTASEELKQKIFENLSTRASDLIREDMEYMGPVRLGDVETAQQRVIDAVRRLEEAGELFVAGRGGRQDVLV